MDTTEQYIKMCEKAEEIQKEWEPDDGDCCYDKYAKLLYPFISGDIVWHALGDTKRERYIFLPRQDRLQEMVKDKYGQADPVGLIWALYRFAGPNRVGIASEFRSMEQLWLAFVMSQKYGKVWNSDKEEWVEE